MTLRPQTTNFALYHYCINAYYSAEPTAKLSVPSESAEPGSHRAHYKNNSYRTSQYFTSSIRHHRYGWCYTKKEANLPTPVILRDPGIWQSPHPRGLHPGTMRCQRTWAIFCTAMNSSARPTWSHEGSLFLSAYYLANSHPQKRNLRLVKNILKEYPVSPESETAP